MKVDNTIWTVVVGAPGSWQLALNTHTSRDAHATATIKDHGPKLQAWKKKKFKQHLKCKDSNMALNANQIFISLSNKEAHK